MEGQIEAVINVTATSAALRRTDHIPAIPIPVRLGRAFLDQSPLD